ncbi:MAG: T9SS type A sorting domain-containing protein [Muribaculaceae bacterium]|nr:T9SS type A sorting domain-containing protein [Muribaculaceae bacterium]
MNKNINILSAIAIFIGLAYCPLTATAAPIEETVEAATDIVPEPQIRVVGQQVEIEISDDDTHQVMVYSLTGQVVKNVTADHGTTLIDLPRGYYIVKVDKSAKRVIVK